MSNYFDNKQLYLEPKVEQYSSHMVMTNVSPEIKTKYINVETKFCNDYNVLTNGVDFSIDLQENINNVVNMNVESIELPISYYNISSTLENNYFKITVIENNVVGASYMITLTNNDYSDIHELVTEINSRIDDSLNSNTYLSRLTAAVLNNKVVFYSNNSDNSVDYQFIIDFAVDSTGNFDKYNIKPKLGWVLGFTDIAYNTNEETQTYQSTGFKMSVAEIMYNLYIPRVLYLVIDEFSSGKQSSFQTMMNRSRNNHNIIAKIAVNKTIYGFGKLFIANGDNGFLISDKRSYNGKTDIRKMNVQLVDEYDRKIDLNGQDFSFTMKVEHQ